jgi:energy-coupling factor transport system permease protein
MNLSKYVIVGQYVPGDSPVYRLDPRAKLLGIACFVALVFLANNAASYALLIGFTILSIAVSRVPLRFLWNGMKPVLVLIAFTAVLHLTFTEGGAVVTEWGWFAIHEEGVRQAVFIALRLLIIIVLTSLLTLTTSPLQLTDGLEQILSPLKAIGVPTHELALMMSIALRFIPTMLEETEKIVKAQMSRGAKLDSGPVWQRMKNLIPVLIPLFISAFRRAEDLATAMEARGYRGGIGRTKLRALRYTWRDLALAGVLLCLLTGLLFLRS